MSQLVATPCLPKPERKLKNDTKRGLRNHNPHVQFGQNLGDRTGPNQVKEKGRREPSAIMKMC